MLVVVVVVVVVLAFIASGCMVVPRTTSRYNADCQVVERRVTLEAQQVGAIGGCRNTAECGGLLAAYGLIAAGSAVVSGSIAVVGNVAYWLEEKAQCAAAGVARAGAEAPVGRPSAPDPSVPR